MTDVLLKLFLWGLFWFFGGLLAVAVFLVIVL